MSHDTLKYYSGKHKLCGYPCCVFRCWENRCVSWIRIMDVTFVTEFSLCDPDTDLSLFAFVLRLHAGRGRRVLGVLQTHKKKNHGFKRSLSTANSAGKGRHFCLHDSKVNPGGGEFTTPRVWPLPTANITSCERLSQLKCSMRRTKDTSKSSQAKFGIRA